ncbi:MAG TPA: hypothetical protein VGN69_02565 [Solirubrobacteraceae bacterium]|nr:hypothetical protein [Solirubrobacteraceae bacterium]
MLVSAMALGSLGLWTVLPIGWLWLASNLVRSNLFSYMFALIACPISMVQAARGLYHLQRRYQHLRQRAAPGPHPTGWLRSLSDERRSMKTITLLDWLMMLSVLVAIVTALIYYFLLSDPLVVTGPQAPGNEHGLQ